MYRRGFALALLTGALALIYLAATHRVSSFAAEGNSGARKVLYWYDAMHPQHHSRQPGKAPDGMDLVPMYAGESAADGQPKAHSAAVPAQGGTSGRRILYWYDPMHPAYKADKPGTAPDCGMALVPQYAEDESRAEMAPGTVVLSQEKQSLAGVRTAVVRREPLIREIRTTAQIVPDETRIAHIHVKVAGYIDRVFVDFVGQRIRKGDPLFTLYSPDLFSAEEEYLLAKRGKRELQSSPFPEVVQGAEALLDSSRERLKLWDISDDQIQQLDRSGKVSKELTFYSPITGFVTDRKAFPQTSVTPDTELYTVADLSAVWADADIYENEAAFVHVDQRVSLQLSYYPGRSYSGTISYIYPTVDPQARTVRARISLPNPGFQLKPGMFADAVVRIDYGPQIVVPQEAVLDSGTVQRVFVVRPGGAFEPRQITEGPVFGDSVAVLAGLKAGETIVTSGNFLIDSESQLRAAMSGMQ